MIRSQTAPYGRGSATILAADHNGFRAPTVGSGRARQGTRREHIIRATLLLMIPAAVPVAAPLPAPRLIGRDYGRSMVIAQQGIVATSQTLASQAGAQILAAGGSAVDAAIAANAALSVLEPMMDGIGGDLFVIYWDAKTGTLTGLNSSGPAPRALTPQFLASKGIHAMPGAGIHSVTVPGAVRGWAAIHQASLEESVQLRDRLCGARFSAARSHPRGMVHRAAGIQ